MTDKETKKIDQLAHEAEMNLELDYEKKDQKERRAIVKETLYEGSKKLKHSIPKGKKV